MKLPPHGHWLWFTSVALFLIGLVAIPQLSQATCSPSPEQTIQRAWQRAQESGAYRFSTDIAQTTHPAPALVNVGHSSRQDILHIEGETNFPERTMLMTLWKGGGSLIGLRDGVEVRVAGDQAYGRQIGGVWQEVDDFSDAFAPGNDLMAYLAGAKNVRELDTETRSLTSSTGEISAAFTRYAFEVDGPAFAEHIRTQLEDYLREKGELPAGLSLDSSNVYRAMTGSGEIWIDSRGLPLRLTVHLDYPPQRNGVLVEADIQTDFADFAPLAQSHTPLARLASALGLPRTPDGWRQVGQRAALAAGSLGLLLLFLAYRKSRQVYAAFVVGIIFSMLVTPLLQSHQVYAFSQRLAAQSEEREQQQQEQDSARQAADEFFTSHWNPHGAPLALANQPVSEPAHPQLLPPSLQSAVSASAEPEPDPDSDDDGDGLTYAEEIALGTAPDNPDSDGDEIRDDVEVQGFEYPAWSGEMWYSDPNNPDSNEDGIVDTYECWSTFPPAGAPPYTIPCDKDSDGDGVPDLFDRDNDGDGVSDRVDLSPARKMGSPAAPFSDDKAFALQVDGLQPGYPVFVDFQLRPTQASHLTYALNVLDWPSGDEAGQVQRHADNNSTFADAAIAQGDSPSPSDANGDMRLVPMLEITIPYDGGYGNLPVKPGAPAVRDKDAAIDDWLDRAKTASYGISVRKKDNAGTLILYVPLNIVADETGGGREAFSARMAYWPNSVSWGAAQQVRVVWLVVMLTDSCQPIPPGTSEAEAETWCDDVNNWVLDKQQPVHTYADEWVLTGLEVREDHGMDVAIALKDPDGDTDTSLDDNLWLLANGLEAVFVSGRDQDGNDVRDVAVTSQHGDSTIASRFDADQMTSGTTITDRWGIPLTATMQIENFSYPDQDHIAAIMMTETINVLNTYFVDAGQPSADAPTLLFAREERYRSVNLDDPSLASIDHAKLTVSADTTSAPQATMAFLSWAPYRYRDGRWASYPFSEYWDLLEVRLQEAFPVDDPTDMDSVYEAAGRTALAKSYYLSMFTGITRMVRIGDQHVWDLDQNELDLSLARQVWKITKNVGKGINVIVAKIATEALQIIPFFKKIGMHNAAAYCRYIGLRIQGLLQDAESALKMSTIKSQLAGMSKAKIGLAVAGAVIAVGVTIALVAQGETAGQVVGIIMSVVSLAIAIKSVVQHGKVFLENIVRLAMGLKTIDTITKAGAKVGVIGLIVGAVVAVGAFIAMWIVSGVSFGSLAFNSMLAGVIATVVVSVIMLAITLIPVVGQIIAAIIALIDSVIFTLCTAFGWSEGGTHSTPVSKWVCKGISGLMSEAIKWAIYSNTIMVDMEADDRLDVQNFQQNVFDPAKGIAVGNALAMSATVTTTIGLASIPIDWKAAAFFWQYSQGTLKSSTFEYQYQVAEQDIHDALSRNQLKTGPGAWESTDDKKVFIVRNVATDGSGVSLDEPGINHTVGLYLAEGYAIPAQECWAVPSYGVPPCPAWPCIPICYIRTEKSTNHIDLGQRLKYDIFPATLDGFYTAARKDGGYSLAWGQDTTITNTLGQPLTFPRQRDFDGDGLLNNMDGGSDPDDSKWDTDGDGLSDDFELSAGSDPTLADTDGDGLDDRAEARLGTDPRRQDSDSDGLTDLEEVNGWEFVYAFTSGSQTASTWVTSDPLDADSDGDTLTDFQEKTYGFNPRAYSSPNVLSFESQVHEADAPRLWLRFDEPAGAAAFADSSGHDTPAVCAAASRPTAGTEGKYGHALRFSGPQPVQAQTSISGSGPFAVAAWVKTNYHGHGYIMHQVTPSWSVAYSLEVLADGHVYWWTYGAGAHGGDSFGFQVTSNRAIDDGEWHHLVGVREVNGTGRLYIDGALDNSASAPARDLAAGFTQIGPNFVGDIDEVAVFDRALSLTQVQQLKAGRYNPDDLIVRPGDALDYRATVKNELYNRYAQGLLSTEFPSLLSDDVPPISFVIQPQEEATISGTVNVSATASSARMDLTQVAGALITDWRELSNFAEMWLRLDESSGATSFADYSGALPPRTGLCSGYRCPASQQPGALGYALHFDGNNDRLTLPDAATLGLYDSSFTVSAWINGDDFSGGDKAILGTDRSSTNKGLLLGVHNSRPYMGFYNNEMNSNFVIPTGEWRHVVFRYDKTTGEMAIFVNGELKRAENGHAAFQGQGAVYLGRAQSGNYFNGYIDDVRAFDRPLTTDEIRALYTQPAFEMHFDEPDGTMIFADSSGFGSRGLCVPYSTCPASIPGISEQGSQFNGAEYITVGANDPLALDEGRFTLSVWLYPDSGDTHTQGILGQYLDYVSTGNPDPNNGDAAAYPTLLRTGRQLRFGFGTGSQWIHRDSGDVLRLDSWNHVALTFGPTYDEYGGFAGNVATLYVNGERQDEWNLGSAAPTAATKQFFVGRATDKGRIYVDGINVTNENDATGAAELCMAWNESEIYNEDHIGDDHGNGQWYDVDEYGTLENTGKLRMWEDDRDHTSRGVRCGSEPDDGDDALDGGTRDSGGWFFSANDAGYGLTERDFAGDSEGTVKISYQNPSIPFHGRIDELSIYKMALSADDVEELYQAGVTGLHLRFDDAPGSASFENSSGAANGTCAWSDEDGGTCPTAGVDGRLDQAVLFDGADDYVEVNQDASEDAYAASLWFETGCPNCGIFSVDKGVRGSGGYDRDVYLQGGDLCARVWHEETICTSGQNYADDRWHHVVHTFGNPPELYPHTLLHLEEGPDSAEHFVAQFYDNRTLSGNPIDTTHDYWPLDYDEQWDGLSNFSIIWQGDFYFDAGTYTFDARSDDGIRVKLDNTWIIDDWSDHKARDYSVARALTRGKHTVTVEYYQHTGNAELKFSWSPMFRDDSGNNYYASCSGSACPVSESGGRLGRALQFDGDDDYIASGATLRGKGPFAVSAWIKTSAAANQVIIQQKGGLSEDFYQLRVKPDGRVNWMILGGSGYSEFDVTSGRAVNDGHWHHVVGARESNGAGRIYIDGVLDGQQSSDPDTLRPNFVYIGADMSNSSQFFDGLIDEVAIFNRAVTPEEVELLYAVHRLYVDGALMASGDKNSSDFTAQTGVNVGFSNAAAHPYFEGYIDDVRLFHRSLATSDAETLFHTVPQFDMRLDESAPTCAFYTEYYTNTTLSGQPAFSGCDSWPINHDWYPDGPENGVGVSDFAARWNGDFYFDGGDYTFIAVTNDGMRVWVDGSRIINRWNDRLYPQNYQATRTLSAGLHHVKVEYYYTDEHQTGDVAVAQLHWKPFFRDDSGHENHGGCDSAAWCPAVGARGRVGLASQFDGLDDLITVPDDPALNFHDIYGAPFSVAAWVKPTQTRTEYQSIVAKADGEGENRNYALRIAPNSMQVQFGFDYRPSLSQDCMYAKEGLSAGSLLQNQWNHIVMTYDGDPVYQLKLYINGRLDKTVNTGLVNYMCQNDEPLRIGGDMYKFTGRIDEVTLYDRALSAHEVRDNFLYQGKWVEDRQSHPVTVDADDPSSELVSVRTATPDYRANRDVVMHVAAQDQTSGVALVKLGVNWPGLGGYTWASAPRCTDASNGVAWCPTFDPTRYGGEGTYRLKTRAVDAVGHVSTSSPVTLYVDDTQPLLTLDLTGGERLDATLHPTRPNAWLVHISGTVRDPALNGGALGSGVVTDSVKVTLLAPNGAPAGAGTQAASLSGGDENCRGTACAWAVDYVLFGAEPSGAYTVTVEAADRIVQLPDLDSAQIARHTASARQNIYVDATASRPHLDLGTISSATLTTTATLQGNVTDRPAPLAVSWTTDSGGDEVGIEIQCLGQMLYAAGAGAFGAGTTYTWDGLVHQSAACQIDLSDSAGNGGVSGAVQVCGQNVATWDGSYTSTHTVLFTANSSACDAANVAGVSQVETAFASILPGSSFYNEIPPAGELLHLPFEDNVDQSGSVTFRDISGQGNDGACSGAGCPAVGAPGHAGSAAHFDGRNDLVNLGHTSINQLTDDFTVMAWIKPAQVSASVQRIIGTSRWHSEDGFGFGLRRAGLRFSTFGVQNYDTSNVTLVPDRWYHVAAVMHSDNNVTFYVDGRARETIAGSNPAIPDSDDNLLIGLDAGRRNPFDGLIDEVRVLDHALTDAEIQALYLGAGPNLALTFDTAWATDGASLADFSGWEHHGTLHTGAGDPFNKAVTGPSGPYGLQFDGLDDYVSLAGSAGLAANNGRFTQAAWVYQSPENNSVYPILSSAAYTETRYDYPFLQIVNRAQLQVGFGDGSSADTFTTGSILTENEWTHVATTFDGATYRIYVNGQERAATTQFSGKTPAPTQRFDIGRGVDSGYPSTCAEITLRELVPHPNWSQRYRVKFEGAVVFTTPEWPAPNESIPLDQSLTFCGSGQLEVKRGVMVWATGQFTWVSLGTHTINTALGSGSHTFADGWASATLAWDVTADPAGMLYFRGALDDVHLYPRVLSALEINALYQGRWQETIVTPGGADLAGWSGAPPAGLEGSYRLDLRGWDMANHADNSVQGRGVWRGAVDTLAPRVTLTRTTVGSDYHYVARAQDFNLIEDGFRSPCGAGFVTARTYFQSPWHAALSGQSANLQRKLYQLSAECDMPIDLTTLQEVGAYQAPGVVHAVAVSGNYAYLAAGHGGLHVLDVSDPAAPSVVGSYRTAGRALDVALAGQYAYLVTPNALLALDVSDPLTPTLASSLPMTTAAGVAVSGQYAYVADAGLKVVNISNPNNITLSGALSWPLDQTRGVALSGSYAYVADSAHGLRIVNVSNPSSPIESGFYNTPTPAYAVALSGTHAYVADGVSGLRVIDVSNPSSPTESGFYDTPGYAQGVALSAGSAYVADGGSGLLEVDISTPTAPQFVNGYDTPGWAADVAISGNYGYVADRNMGLRIVNLGGGSEQATACDMAGNCTTAGYNSATAPSHSSPLTVSIVSLPATIDSSAPISITGTAETITSSLRALTITVDSIPISTTGWASGAVSSTVWVAAWTPSEGLHLVQAAVINWDGDIASDTVTVTVDTQPPQVVIAPTVLTSVNYHDPRTFDLTGLVTDTSRTAGVQATVAGYGAPYQAIVNGNAWLAPWYLGQGALPDGAPYTVTAQATDAVGLTGRVTETVLADVVPPAPVTLTLHSGGGIILPGDTVRAPSPTLTLTWSASSDGSGLSDYLTEWTAQTTGTATTTLTAHDPLTRSARYRAGDGQKIEVQLASQDIYGQQTWQGLGPVYADGPQTPDYVLLDDPDGVYLGWMGSGCTLAGVDSRINRAGGAAGAALGAEQNFYVTWNAAALRLAWTGANWGSDGDLFVYLDVRAGGAITAFNPYLATMTDTVIYLPGATPLSPTGGMAADYLVWVRDSHTALLLEWDGSDWAFDTALPYRFAPDLDGGHTDLYLPFDLLGIADPSTAALDMVAFASEEDALRLWAVMPNDSSVNSARVVGTPAYVSATQEFALNRRYHWDSLGDGVCPNGSCPDSDLAVRIAAQPAGAAYNFLEDNLFGLWSTLLGNRPPDVSSFLGYNPNSLAWVGDSQTITYTINYRNRGAYTATNVYADVTALYALRFSGGVTNQIVFLGNIGPGAEGTATFQGVVDTGASAIPWASVEAKIYDAAHTPAGPPLEWVWVDNPVDNAPPVFYGIRQPDYLIAAGDNTLYGYAYDHSGVPTLTMQIQGDGALTCLDETPTDGRWSCDWNASAHDGGVLNARLQAVDGSGNASPWSDWQPFLVDGTPPTVTLDITVTSAISGGLFRDSAFDLSGDVSDEGGVAEVEVCLDDDCGTAGLLLGATPAPLVLDDAPPAPIAIDSAATCGGGEIVRTFAVTDDFALAEVSLGFAAAHSHRDDLQVTLESPDGTTVLALFDDGISGTGFQNYDVLLNDAQAAGLDSLWGDHDPSAPHLEYQSRPYAPLQAFRGKNSAGTWTLRICDTNPATDDGVYYRSRLVLTPRHTASQSGSWYYTTPSGEQLDYVKQTIALYGVDVVGNRNAAPTSIKVTIDNVAPLLTVTNVADRIVFTPTARALDGVVSDGGPAVNTTVRVETPGGELYSEPAAQTGDGWHYDLHPASTGIYQLWVSASDLAGNVTTEGPFEVEVIEPAVVFMPLVAKNYVSGPDLVVERIVVTSDNAQVVIGNVGDTPVSDEFWVDLYVAPAAAPTAVNQTWDHLGSQGLVWGVTASALPALAPGGSFTLTLGDAYYWPSASYVAWPLAEETQIWAQVDSANANTDYGAVLENHEIAGGEYNNVTGPVDSVESASGMAAPPNVGAPHGRSSGILPPRPRQNTEMR